MAHSVPTTEPRQKRKRSSSFLTCSGGGVMSIGKREVACGDQNERHFHEAENQSGKIVSGCMQNVAEEGE